MTSSIVRADAEREAWMQNYELLRTTVLVGGLAGEAPLGLALLLRQGVAGWLDALGRVESVAAPEPARQVPHAAVPIGAVAADLTRVLVAMALGAVRRSCHAS